MIIDAVRRLYRATQYSINGLKAAWRGQWAFRFEMILLLIAIPFVFIFGSSPVEYALMLSSIILLPMMELMNSAVEAAVDRIGLEHHELSGLAKDLASAALLVAAINAFVIWGFIFYEWLRA